MRNLSLACVDEQCSNSTDTRSIGKIQRDVGKQMNTFDVMKALVVGSAVGGTLNCYQCISELIVADDRRFTRLVAANDAMGWGRVRNVS